MAEPEPTPRPARRRGVGPFSLRQVTGAIVLVMGVAIVLTLASVPLGSIAPGLPRPDPSAFLIGSPIPGLRVGDLAPELAVDRAGRQQAPADRPRRQAGAARRPARQGGVGELLGELVPAVPVRDADPADMDQRYRDRGLALVAVQVQQTVDDGRSYAIGTGSATRSPPT